MASIVSAGTTNSTALNMTADTSGVLQLASNNGTVAVTVDTSQNVGVGTSSPATYGKFAVVSSTAGAAKISIQDTSGGSASSLLQFGINDTSGFNTIDASRIWTTAASSTVAILNFAAYNTVAPSTAQMVLTGGNLLVGTTSTAGSSSNASVVVAGIFRTLSGSGGLSNGASATLFTISVSTTYIVTIQTANASGQETVAIVSYPSGGNGITISNIQSTIGNFSITSSGTNIQATNTLGGPINYGFTAVRIY